MSNNHAYTIFSYKRDLDEPWAFEETRFSTLSSNEKAIMIDEELPVALASIEMQANERNSEWELVSHNMLLIGSTLILTVLGRMRI